MLDWRKCQGAQLLISQMFSDTKYMIQSIVALVGATILFSCQGDLKDVNQFTKLSNNPQSRSYDVNLFYTDSGRVKVNLRSPEVLDYTHQDFPYREFPHSVDVDFYSEDSSKSSIFAKYAIFYDETGLVDMQDSVSITTDDGVVLTAEQLYWDQDESWIYTDQNYKLRLSNGTTNNGEGFDANQEFNIFNSRSNIGKQIIDNLDE